MTQPPGLTLDCLKHPITILDPKPQDFSIHTIARALANTCRFKGAIPGGKFYSTAEHSMRVAEVAVRNMGNHVIRKSCYLVALLHDAHESVIGDISAPLVRALDADIDLAGPLSYLKRNLDTAIGKTFDVDMHDEWIRPAVKAADTAVTQHELRELYNYERGKTIDGLAPALFLERGTAYSALSHAITDALIDYQEAKATHERENHVKA